MTIFGFTVGEVFAVLGTMAAFVGGYVRLQMISNQNSRAAADALRIARQTRDEVQAVQLDFAQKYASVEHLKEVEARLAVSIDRLTDRIDKLISSMGH